MPDFDSARPKPESWSGEAAVEAECESWAELSAFRAEDQNGSVTSNGRSIDYTVLRSNETIILLIVAATVGVSTAAVIRRWNRKNGGAE
ncbi:hypothetical protein [Nocardia terpenica]|uniref:hypothetical protein n=1 Tax=Nocardia terpenica TaxID=455432 RepID=UPI0012E8C4A3|nr:hypothetical protein [Nocardia terpenica]NQE90900.1 hypothetical protein [Nocardia terpenica]